MVPASLAEPRESIRIPAQGHVPLFDVGYTRRESSHVPTAVPSVRLDLQHKIQSCNTLYCVFVEFAENDLLDAIFYLLSGGMIRLVSAFSLKHRGVRPTAPAGPEDERFLIRYFGP